MGKLSATCHWRTRLFPNYSVKSCLFWAKTWSRSELQPFTAQLHLSAPTLWANIWLSAPCRSQLTVWLCTLISSTRCAYHLCWTLKCLWVSTDTNTVIPAASQASAYQAGTKRKKKNSKYNRRVQHDQPVCEENCKDSTFKLQWTLKRWRQLKNHEGMKWWLVLLQECKGISWWAIIPLGLFSKSAWKMQNKFFHCRFDLLSW